jgi:hypothetical protein
LARRSEQNHELLRDLNQLRQTDTRTILPLPAAVHQ